MCLGGTGTVVAPYEIVHIQFKCIDTGCALPLYILYYTFPILWLLLIGVTLLVTGIKEVVQAESI
jgi:hypothetical protein